MSSKLQQQRRPPLAGRPPFATDEDDSVYDNPPAARPRLPVKEQKHTTARDSMYSAWDSYLKDERDRPQSGAGGIGMGLMALDEDDEDDDEPPVRKPVQKSQAPASVPTTKPSTSQQPQQQTQPLNTSRSPAVPNKQTTSNSSSRAPPVVAAPASSPAPRQPPMANVQTQPLTRPQQQLPPVAASSQPRPVVTRSPPPPNFQPKPILINSRSPPPMQHPMPRQAPGVSRPAALQVDTMPRAPIPAFMQGPPPPVPGPPQSAGLNPHPLNAPTTPITPVFAQPKERKVEFTNEAILRGNSEETLLPRNTAKGAEFWHRFSVVAKDDARTKHTQSPWLKRYEGGRNRMSRWVWCISIVILLAIGAGIGLGWYFSHNKPSLPVAVGGSANEAATISDTNRIPAPTADNNTSRTLIAPPARETKRAAIPVSSSERRRSTIVQPGSSPMKRATSAAHARRWRGGRASSINGLN